MESNCICKENQTVLVITQEFGDGHISYTIYNDNYFMYLPVQLLLSSKMSTVIPSCIPAEEVVLTTFDVDCISQ